MSAEDKMKAARDKITGTAKEAAGRVMHDDDLVAKGKADKLKGEAHEAKGHVKDAAEDVKRAVDR